MNFWPANVFFAGARTIVPEEICPLGRLWGRVRAAIRLQGGGGGQFSSGASVLEPFFAIFSFFRMYFFFMNDFMSRKLKHKY